MKDLHGRLQDLVVRHKDDVAVAGDLRRRRSDCFDLSVNLAQGDGVAHFQLAAQRPTRSDLSGHVSAAETGEQRCGESQAKEHGCNNDGDDRRIDAELVGRDD